MESSVPSILSRPSGSLASSVTSILATVPSSPRSEALLHAHLLVRLPEPPQELVVELVRSAHPQVVHVPRAELLDLPNSRVAKRSWQAEVDVHPPIADRIHGGEPDPAHERHAGLGRGDLIGPAHRDLALEPFEQL